MVEALIKSPLDLRVAAAHGLDILVELITKENPNFINESDDKGYKPLHYALVSNHVTTVRFLVENGLRIK